MLGAILGDIVGSVYEFDNIKTTEFNIKNNKATFTDDTILTCAVADVLIHQISDSKEVAKILQKWCRLYPNPKGGYGGHFLNWIWQDEPIPYRSAGNGAIMRISPVGWVAKSEEEVHRFASLVTEVSHNSYQAMSSADKLAMAIFLARKKKTKDYIKKYLSERKVDCDTDLNVIRKEQHFYPCCKETMDIAMSCFFKSNSFEECLRLTVSMGGDVDTNCAVSCALAEAYYGIPKDLEDYVLSKMDEKQRKIYEKFNELIKKEK